MRAERWEGFIDEDNGDTLVLRLYPPEGDVLWATMPRENFRAPIAPHEIREGVIFFWDIDESGIRWSTPPRYTQAEIDEASMKADALCKAFARAEKEHGE